MSDEEEVKQEAQDDSGPIDCGCASQAEHDGHILQQIQRFPVELRYGMAKRLQERADARIRIMAKIQAITEKFVQEESEGNLCAFEIIALLDHKGQKLPIIARAGNPENIAVLGVYLTESRRDFINEYIQRDVSMIVSLGGAIKRTNWLESDEAKELQMLYGDELKKGTDDNRIASNNTM